MNGREVSRDGTWSHAAARQRRQVLTAGRPPHQGGPWAGQEDSGGGAGVPAGTHDQLSVSGRRHRSTRPPALRGACSVHGGRAAPTPRPPRARLRAPGTPRPAHTPHPPRAAGAPGRPELRGRDRWPAREPQPPWGLPAGRGLRLAGLRARRSQVPRTRLCGSAATAAAGTGRLPESTSGVWLSHSCEPGSCSLRDAGPLGGGCVSAWGRCGPSSRPGTHRRQASPALGGTDTPASRGPAGPPRSHRAWAADAQLRLPG